MNSTKALLAKKLQQNTHKHQVAQRENLRDVKEFRRQVLLDDIAINVDQPRRLFCESEILSLAESIQEIGLLQPISVRKTEGSKYQIIAGERRFRAHKLLGKSYIEAVILDVSLEEASLLTLAENLKRQDLADYEIYLGLTNLDESLKSNKQKLAKSLGMNREDMYKYLSYSQLPHFILKDLNENPLLLGRTAATAVKKFLADEANHQETALSILADLWSDLKIKKIEQTKISALASKRLHALLVPVTQQPSKSYPFKFHGKTQGKIKYDNETLNISLKVENFNEDDLTQVQKFLESFIDSKKV